MENLTEALEGRRQTSAKFVICLLDHMVAVTGLATVLPLSATATTHTSLPLFTKEKQKHKQKHMHMTHKLN
jgi:hypothetical protein